MLIYCNAEQGIIESRLKKILQYDKIRCRAKRLTAHAK